jgi:ferredoxin
MLYSVKAAPGGREASMRVVVDRDACEANAICAGLVPEIFEVDDDDELHVLTTEVPERLADLVGHAVAACPKAALRLVP